jgi:PKD repeat protein
MKLLTKKGLAFAISICAVIHSLNAQYGPEDFTPVSLISENQSAPGRMAIDKNDHIFVVDAIQNRILKYNTQGVFLANIDPQMNPISIAVNSQGKLFVGDRITGNIYKVAEDGSKSLFYQGLILPNSMVFGFDNILYVTESIEKRVVGIDPSGQLVADFTHSTFVFPTGIAFDPQNSHIIVAEHGGIGEDMECGGGCSLCWSSYGPQTSIYIFDLQGNHVTTFGCFGEDEGLFHRIQGISVGNCGYIYATDPYLGRVSVFDESGNYITMFGQQGNAHGEFNLPMDVGFDSNNNLYIASMNKGKMDIFSMAQALPTSTIVGMEEMVCTGNSAEILIKLTGTAPWTFTYTIDGLNPTQITTSEAEYYLSAPTHGIYEIIDLTDANNFIGSCLTGAINIMPSEVTVDLGADVTICEGGLYLLDAGEYQSYMWSDGSTNRTLEVSVAGEYHVTVTNEAGCSATDIINIDLSLPPSANFSYTANELQVQFANESANASSHHWDFGDGNTSTEENPVHTYSFSGVYEVVYTAIGSVCEDSQSTQSIEVEEGSLSLVDKNFHKNKTLDIYPNPTTGEFTIKLNTGGVMLDEIELYINTSTGQSVYVATYNSWEVSFYQGSYYIPVTLYNFNQGIYIINVQSGYFNEQDKLVIKD